MGEDDHMDQISQVGRELGPQHLPATQLDAVERQARSDARRAESPRETGEVDQAEISELGRLLEQAYDQPGIRADKVAEARLAIERDEQAFIEHRLQLTVDRLMDDLL